LGDVTTVMLPSRYYRAFVPGAWNQDAAGVVVLPSGRSVRGRALHATTAPAGPEPEFGLYLLGHKPPTAAWPHHWLRWPDFRLPSEPLAARQALLDVWRRSERERVEIACGGGRGRTGTAIACLAVLDGIPSSEAVLWTRQRYGRRAVETPWQRRFVDRFDA